MRRIITTVALATALSGAALLGPTPAEAATCHAHKVSGHSYWTCITPGSYCPKAAHLHYGYAKTTNRRYKCSRYSNGAWRWKRA